MILSVKTSLLRPLAPGIIFTPKLIAYRRLLQENNRRSSEIYLLDIVEVRRKIICWKRRVYNTLAAVLKTFFPGRVAQSVTCLATDASLTADPGIASSIPPRSHTFVEIDHEIISTVILLPSAESFKKGCCQLQAKVCARSTG